MFQFRHTYDRTSGTKISDGTIDYLEGLLKKMDTRIENGRIFNFEYSSSFCHLCSFRTDIRHRINEANLGLFTIYWKSRYFIFKRKRERSQREHWMIYQELKNVIVI